LRAAQKLLDAPTIGAESVRAWWGGGGGSQRSQIHSCRPECTKTVKKQVLFLHFLSYKSPKMLYFAKKYFTRYTFETFFEEYINFKFFIT
jgi:hypothetical protein